MVQHAWKGGFLCCVKCSCCDRWAKDLSLFEIHQSLLVQLGGRSRIGSSQLGSMEGLKEPNEKGEETEKAFTVN